MEVNGCLVCGIVFHHLSLYYFKDTIFIMVSAMVCHGFRYLNTRSFLTVVRERISQEPLKEEQNALHYLPRAEGPRFSKNLNNKNSSCNKLCNR